MDEPNGFDTDRRRDLFFEGKIRSVIRQSVTGSEEVTNIEAHSHLFGSVDKLQSPSQALKMTAK